MPRPKPSLKARALSYLAAREHSRQELARKLARHVEDGDDLDAVLDWLQAQKFLSETRFAESLVHRRAARFGNSRILSELQSHGLDEGAIDGWKDELQASELERAWEVWRRKFHAPATDAAGTAKQMRFLQQRGFSHSAIQSTLRRAKQQASEEGDAHSEAD